MTSMFDELWPLFLAEVTEQLDTLELELVKQDIEQVDVDQLFRLFHTIKSSCAMLDFKSMEEIAHTSEDVLDLVRKEILSISDKMIDIFIDAVEALKDQLQEAAEHKGNPKPRADLVSSIRVFMEGAAEKKGDENSSAEEPIANEEYEQLERLLSDNLCLALCPFSLPEGESCKKYLIKLRNFFDLMELDQVSFLVKKIITKIALDEQLLSCDSQRVVAEILDRLFHLEDLSNRDLSVSACRAQYQNFYKEDFVKHLKAVSADFLVLYGSGQNGEEYPRELAKIVSLLTTQSRIFGFSAMTDLLGLLNQLIKARCYGDQKLNIDAVAVSRALIEFDVERYDNKKYLLLTSSLAADISGSEGYDYQNSKNYHEWSDQLMNKSLWDQQGERMSYQEIDEIYGQGGAVVEIYADLESDHEFANEFVVWLYKNSKVITNIFVDVNKITNLSVDAGVAFLVCCTTQDVLKVFIESLKKHAHYIQYQQSSKNQQAAANNQNGPAKESGVSSSLRVDSKTLDDFVSRVGEMVTLKNTMTHIVLDPSVKEAFKTTQDFLNNNNENHRQNLDQTIKGFDCLQNFYAQLVQVNRDIHQAINRIQEDVLELRVVPISLVFNRLPVMVRKLSRELNKDVSLVLKGEEVKIDKSLVDFLMEPISHLIRNSLDHGIESESDRMKADKPKQSILSVSAVNRGSSLRIEIKDDGRGLQKEKILRKAQEKNINVSESASDQDIYNLIFVAGFSTSDVITETSGRGVGMDVVRTKISAIGGSVTVNSEPGLGTTFQLDLPLSVAVQGMLIVESAVQKYAIPEKDVLEVIDIHQSDLKAIDGQLGFILRGDLVPLYNLDHLLDFPTESQWFAEQYFSIVVVSNDQSRIGLGVATIIGRQETYIQDVDAQLLTLPGFGGATILGDGSVAVILDSEKLLYLAVNAIEPASSMMLTANI